MKNVRTLQGEGFFFDSHSTSLKTIVGYNFIHNSNNADISSSI